MAYVRHAAFGVYMAWTDRLLILNFLQYEAKALGDLLRRGHPNADKKVGVAFALPGYCM